MSSQVIPRGAMILFEGGDKCGKTTHCTKLVEALRQDGKRAEMIKFPVILLTVGFDVVSINVATDHGKSWNKILTNLLPGKPGETDRQTATGRVISDYLSKKENLSDHAIHLMFAANRWEAMPQMKKKLEEGITLVVDRYSYSGVAYSMAKQIEGMDFAWCWNSEVGLLRPDAVLLLTVSPAAAAKRQAQVPERFEEAPFQQRVLVNFRSMKTANWTEIDTSGDVDEVHADIKAAVDRVMLNVFPSTIEYLR